MQYIVHDMYYVICIWYDVVYSTTCIVCYLFCSMYERISYYVLGLMHYVLSIM